MPHLLFVAGLSARDIYPELKKYFYKEHSNVTQEKSLTVNFGLWVDTRAGPDNALHGSSRQWKKAYYFILKSIQGQRW